MASQDNWRFCTKCYSLFWYGYPSKGVCADGGAHSPFESASPTHAGSSYNFELQIASTAAPPSSPGTGGGAAASGYQGNWRFCTKCYSLFWWGYPTGGVCPAGGQHSPLESASPTHAGSSYDFALRVASEAAPPSSPGTGGGAAASGYQGNWRFCTKCYSLFWWGYPTGGVCPAHGQHSPLESASPTHAGSSYDFELQIASTAPPPPPPPPYDDHPPPPHDDYDDHPPPPHDDYDDHPPPPHDDYDDEPPPPHDDYDDYDDNPYDDSPGDDDDDDG